MQRLLPRCFWRPRRARLLRVGCACSVALLLLNLVMMTMMDTQVTSRQTKGHAPYLPRSHFIRTWSGSRPRTANATQLILLWTSYFRSRSWGTLGNFLFSRCPVSGCKVTTDRFLLTEASAVLFHARNLLDQPPPTYRDPSQVWILHNSEPPYNVPTRLAGYGTGFNWTSSYRRDADIHSPYGAVRKLPPRSPSPLSGHSHSNDVFARKTRMVAWVASNCRDYGRRYRFVQELEQHMVVDKFGKCHGEPCPRTYACEERLQSYKFLLALENGLCRDYVTEKFWRALQRQQIPVVRGSADYAKVAPPHSFINVDDFPDIASLARHLHLVARNATLYNAHFRWMEDYEVRPRGYMYLDACAVCAALHDFSRPSQVYRDMEGWFRQDTCPMGSTVLEWLSSYLDLFLFEMGF